MARFTDFNAKIQARLSTGEAVEVYTVIQAYGDYKQRTEDMHPDGIGYYKTFSEQEVYEDTAEVVYPDEWEFVDEKKQECIEDYDGITIIEILKIIDVDWGVDTDTIYEDEDDC